MSDEQREKGVEEKVPAQPEIRARRDDDGPDVEGHAVRGPERAADPSKVAAKAG